MGRSHVGRDHDNVVGKDGRPLVESGGMHGERVSANRELHLSQHLRVLADRYCVTERSEVSTFFRDSTAVTANALDNKEHDAVRPRAWRNGHLLSNDALPKRRLQYP